MRWKTALLLCVFLVFIIGCSTGEAGFVDLSKFRVNGNIDVIKPNLPNQGTWLVAVLDGQLALADQYTQSYNVKKDRIIPSFEVSNPTHELIFTQGSTQVSRKFSTLRLLIAEDHTNEGTTLTSVEKTTSDSVVVKLPLASSSVLDEPYSLVVRDISTGKRTAIYVNKGSPLQSRFSPTVQRAQVRPQKTSLFSRLSFLRSTGRAGATQESCDTLADNNGDGLLDCQECSDSIDNDGDGLIDCQDDDCSGKIHHWEECRSAPDKSCPTRCQHPETACYDFFDNDNDGFTDCDDYDCNGRSGPNGTCKILPEANCLDSIDNDGDGSTDCDDSDCSFACSLGNVCDALTPVFSSHNDASNENRANIVFVGFDTSKQQFEGVLPHLLDVEGKTKSSAILSTHNYDSRPGLFSTNPFRQNENQFNFWYVDQTIPLPEKSTSGSQRCTFLQNSPIRHALEACGYKNLYLVGIGDIECSGMTSLTPSGSISETNQFSIHNPKIISTFIHEMGHSFGKLWDEYVLQGDLDWSGEPNCLDTVEEANVLWGDFFPGFTTKNGVEPRIFNGCSYVLDNKRFHDHFLMRSSIKEEFGIINEIHICRRILDETGDVNGCEVALRQADAEYHCVNDIDHDGDGLVGCNDPDCTEFTTCAEICHDGLDNDGDNLVDCLDPSCSDDSKCDEICNDDIDNNGDGKVDCQDERCDKKIYRTDSSSTGQSNKYCYFGEETNCVDNFDNDGDGSFDCADSDCKGHGTCASGSKEKICNDGIDNDVDGILLPHVDGKLLSGSSCKVNKDCYSGWCSQGVCKGDFGDQCDDGHGCDPDLACNWHTWGQGSCVGTTGSQCDSNENCYSGWCVDGTCKGDEFDKCIPPLVFCNPGFTCSEEKGFCVKDPNYVAPPEQEILHRWSIDCEDIDCDQKQGDLNGNSCEYGHEVSCQDGFDNDADGKIDCLDSDCATSGVC